MLDMKPDMMSKHYVAPFRHNSTHIAFCHLLMIHKLKELEMIIDK
jgi:hypothetical protein